MQKKFLRENHNRQDKARKPDYREGLIEESADLPPDIRPEVS